MNLNRRIPLRDSDRAPHRGDEHDGCISIFIGLLILGGTAAAGFAVLFSY